MSPASALHHLFNARVTPDDLFVLRFLLPEQKPESVQRPDVTHFRPVKGGQLQKLGTHDAWSVLWHGVEDLSDLPVHLKPTLPLDADDAIM